MSIYVEPFAGSAAVALQLIGGGRAIPPIGYMGGKRRIASEILGTVGLHPGHGADLVALIDAGPWGEAWEVIFDAERRPALVGRLRSWRGIDPSELWEQLRDAGRPDDVVERVASWLWLQGRAANNSPVWWGGASPVMPGNGSRGPGTTAALQNTCWRLTMPEKMNRGEPLKDAIERSTRKASSSRHASSGVTRPDTVADRIEAIGSLRWPRVIVGRSHADLDGIDMEGAVVYADPPYLGCTRYAALCPRDEVLRLSLAWRKRGARVVVSEACALPLDGWHALQLQGTRKPEWLTCSEPPVVRRAVQMHLWQAA